MLLLFLIPFRMFGQSKNASSPVQGTASFYHDGFEGQETASGELFQTKKLTAASNKFNLQSWVRVTNLRNNKSVIVRIIDRMHPRMAKRGRIVDLSLKAAKRIKMLGEGLAKVKVELVPTGTEE